MADTPDKKNILNAIHDGLQWCLHMAAAPPVAALKAVIAGLTYIHDELAKL